MHKSLPRMSRNKYFTFCIATFASCTLAWIFNMYADANAQYLLDVNSHIASSVSKYINFSSLNLLFYIPLIVIALSKRSITGSILWLTLSALIMLTTYLFIGIGGDKHGCESCAGIYLLHIYALPPLAILTLAIILIKKIWQLRKA